MEQLYITMNTGTLMQVNFSLFMTNRTSKSMFIWLAKSISHNRQPKPQQPD